MFIARQRRKRQGAVMLAGLSVAIALLAQAPSPAPANPPPAENAPAYGPVLPEPPRAPAPKPPVETTEATPPNRCTTAPAPVEGEIVVCVERPQGYRLDPDLVEARRQM